MKQKLLIFVPTTNAAGRNDVTGAFLPSAQKLSALYPGSEIVRFDNTKQLPVRATAVLAAIDARVDGGFTSVSFLCHGWVDGIQAGFTRRTAPKLAAAIAKMASTPPRIVRDAVIVPLYCCSTGDDPGDQPTQAAGTGDNSFADKLRDALCAAGQVNCRVVAHTTAGHTTQNPNVLFFDGMGIPDGGVGGYAPVRVGSPLWSKWKSALLTGDLRYRFPFMSAADIHAELSGVVA